jgi:SDR family mycofactocin-dependent oxidoreductase
VVVGKLDGKVAFITGVARGQGRSHAVHLAREGCDIIGVDLCDQIASVRYPMATKDDLDETVRLVRAEGRQIVASTCDVRDAEALTAAVRQGAEQLGRLDIVLANAGIMPILGLEGKTPEAFRDAIEVMLIGVYNSGRATLPILLEQGSGGSVVITSSTAGLKTPVMGSLSDGLLGYFAAKHGVVGIMRAWANAYGKYNIRVNSIHPTGVATPMIMNEAFAQFAQDEPEAIGGMQNLLPVPHVQPSDVSNAVIWLCSEEGRYVHGVTLPVDAGLNAR